MEIEVVAECGLIGNHLGDAGERGSVHVKLVLQQDDLTMQRNGA